MRRIEGARPRGPDSKEDEEPDNRCSDARGHDEHPLGGDGVGGARNRLLPSRDYGAEGVLSGEARVVLL